MIAAAGIAVIIGVGTFLATRAPDQTQVAISEPVTLKTTWAVPLFDGQSQTGWVAQKPGTQWEVIPDPVEGAYALAVKAREKSEGSIRRRISGLSSASPFFEVEFNLLLHTATAAGLQFGMTETPSGYRLRVTRDDIALLNESGEELHKTDSPPEVTKTLQHVRLRLQETGWRVDVNSSAVGGAPPAQGILPEIRLFMESGQAFFTDIIARGLQSAEEESGS